MTGLNHIQSMDWTDEGKGKKGTNAWTSGLGHFEPDIVFAASTRNRNQMEPRPLIAQRAYNDEMRREREESLQLLYRPLGSTWDMKPMTTNEARSRCCAHFVELRFWDIGMNFGWPSISLLQGLWGFQWDLQILMQSGHIWMVVTHRRPAAQRRKLFSADPR
jgi:hypothetical protein